ncbi:MAG: efflux RND transporter periplasmic adaptor subunit [Phenylobacterium sp.]|uniref:efflux RND transporter periplasmic adaptor subunit n=1 Tax=Phenylobacterium sp. TaxID=1871053 RepID=UPI002725A8C2|nr:efflux RND transporter periplasmic adaptor subunit [Phenylobacterium sp.]MDO8912132.1 efflux RND transporter periplasmic adaptor subunit [Phenylobacterium sp.]
MTARSTPKTRLAVGGVVIAALAAAGGFGLAKLGADRPAASEPAGRQVLYWYDPMVPAQHFDKPGKSPFMDMPLVPKYAGAGGEANGPGVVIDPARTQSLGVRLASVERGTLSTDATAAGSLDFNERDIAIVQAKAAGFVQRVYSRAPGDVVAAGAPLADILVPEWGGAQSEFLAVRRTSDAALTAAARQRLILLGMSPATVAQVERSGRPQTVVTVTTPTAGVIKTLNVRNGMTVSAGQTLAEVNGLSRVWLNAAVPEALAAQVRLGQSATATLSALPGETFSGRVAAILPQANAESRTLTVRVELPNRGGRLRPGMFATVQLGGPDQPALLVPSEAVIRTGRRTLVMIAQAGGRYLPAEIRIGREASGKTEVLGGLSEGEKVVASGQFLIDSEASLSGLQPRVMGVEKPAQARPPVAATYETVGRIEQVASDKVTLSHQPVPALQWPAMTMTFRVENPSLVRGYKVGDQIRFGFEQTPTGPTLRRISRAGGQ